MAAREWMLSSAISSSNQHIESSEWMVADPEVTWFWGNFRIAGDWPGIWNFSGR